MRKTWAVPGLHQPCLIMPSFPFVCFARTAGEHLKALRAVFVLPRCTTNDLGGWVGVPLFRMPHLPALLMDANYPVKLSFLLNQEMVSECSRKPSPVDYSWHGRWNLFAVLALAHGGRDHVLFVFGARHIRASTNEWVSEWILTSIFAFTMDSAVTPIKANGFNQGRISSLNTRISLYEKRNVNRTLIREFTNYSSLLRTLAGV